MHMARKAFKFNRNIEVGFEEENVQDTSSFIFISVKQCQMLTVSM